MRKELNARGERLRLRDLLLGQGSLRWGDVARSSKKVSSDVRVFDPNVRFISLSNSLHLRNPGGGQAKF